MRKCDSKILPANFKLNRNEKTQIRHSRKRVRRRSFRRRIPSIENIWSAKSKWIVSITTEVIGKERKEYGCRFRKLWCASAHWKGIPVLWLGKKSRIISEKFTGAREKKKNTVNHVSHTYKKGEQRCTTYRMTRWSQTFPSLTRCQYLMVLLSMNWSGNSGCIIEGWYFR